MEKEKEEKKRSSKSGREEVKKKEGREDREEDTMADTREIIYLRKPGLEARPGPPASSAESWHSSSASPSSPSTTLPTLCRSKGNIQGGRGQVLGQGTNIANGTLHGEGNCMTAATHCFDSGTIRGKEDDPAVDTDFAAANGNTERSSNLNRA
jgi:hypothetical protein